MSDVDDKMGLTRTATGAMIGLIAGPWGAAIGAGIGLALDFAAANDSTGDALERANAAAANSSLSVQTRIAAVDAEIAAIKRLRAERIADQHIGTKGGVGVSGPDTTEQDAALKKLAATRKELTTAAQDALFAEFGLTSAMQGTSQATRDQTAATLANLQAHNQRTDQLLGAFNAETAYRQALKAAGDQAKSNNAGLKGSSEAALANRQALGQLAGAWNQLADSGGATEAQMKKARAAFIKVAEDMGEGSQRARKLADDMLHIPSPNPKVNVETGPASARVAEMRGSLDRVDKMRPNPKINADTGQASNKLTGVIGLLRRIVSKSVTVTTIHRVRRAGLSDRGNVARGRADGGYIRGPGGPRDDAIPAWLSDGEYVINAAATRRFLPLLERLNEQKFATGGPVASRLTPPDLTSIVRGGDGASAPIELNQNVYPQPGQSEQEIGRHSANRLLWALDLT
jgi:hypothetical protein